MATYANRQPCLSVSAALFSQQFTASFRILFEDSVIGISSHRASTHGLSHIAHEALSIRFEVFGRIFV
jgi:hypothetical protein